MSAEAEREKKKRDEQNLRVLQSLLNEPTNSLCADCGQKGIFLCFYCLIGASFLEGGTLFVVGYEGDPNVDFTIPTLRVQQQVAFMHFFPLL